LRWRIEIAFKHAKSGIGMVRPPGEDPGLAKVHILLPVADRLKEARCPQFCERKVRAGARRSLVNARQNRLPHAPLRGACGVLDPARPAS
jgi:hypothetical protein